MDQQNQQLDPVTPEKKKRVSFWSPEDMISPQVIHTEPDLPNLNSSNSMMDSSHNSPQVIHTEPDLPNLNSSNSMMDTSHNSDVSNSHQSAYSSYPDMPQKFKTESDYNSSSVIKFTSDNNFNSSSAESSPNSKKKSKKEVDSTKPYKCTQCPYSFNRRDHLARHSLVHSKIKPYHCSYCSKDFTRNDHLRRHQQRVHYEEVASATIDDVTQRFVCQECKAIFSSSGHLTAHIESKHHSDFSEYITLEDDPLKKNTSSGTYVVVDGKKRPVCTQCNRSFSKKDHLVRHMNSVHNATSEFETYSPDQSYNCQMCGKRFSRPEFLRRHIEDVHSQASQMEILNHLNPNNSYNIQTNSSLHENGIFIPPPPHMIQNSSFFGFENIPALASSSPKSMKNSSPKDHKCSICNKNFSRKYHLVRHQKSLHSDAFVENN